MFANLWTITCIIQSLRDEPRRAYYTQKDLIFFLQILPETTLDLVKLILKNNIHRKTYLKGVFVGSSKALWRRIAGPADKLSSEV